MDNMDGTKQVLEDVLSERIRQVTQLGYSLEHDDAHTPQEFVTLCRTYVDEAGAKHAEGDLPGCRTEMVKAVSLLVAMVENLDRAEVSDG